jgi:GT2 family glycosyltransferase
MDALPPVSIIVLNFNGRDMLKGCLDSILAEDYPAFEVILVDNASIDGSVDFVKERYATVRLLTNASNLGFAEGNNKGVEEAAHDLVILVNNDVVVEPGWLKGLVGAMAEPEVAMASSLVRTVGIPGHNIMLAFEDPNDLFFCTGCSVIFRKSEFGLPFDPEYFAYAEDIYLGLRARFAGRKVRHVPDSRLLHLGGQTAGKQRSAFIAFYQERNRILNALVFFDLWTRLRLAPYFGVNLLAKTAHGLLRSRPSLPGIWRAYVWLLTHPRVVSRKRSALRRAKSVADRVVLRAMSCKVVDSESFPARMINALSSGYCRLVGITTLEHTPESQILRDLRSRMASSLAGRVEPPQ